MMSVVLLDTTVASLLHPKKKGTEVREHYEKHMQGQTLALCFFSPASLFPLPARNPRYGISA